MHPYILVLVLGALLCAFLFSLRLKKALLPGKMAVTALGLSAMLGFVLSKSVYVVCLLHRLYPRYGMAAFTRMALSEFSFVGGALGVVLGVMIAAKWHKVRMLPALDAFAPIGALMLAIARGGEYFLGMQGVGAYLENESISFFPIAVQNEWDEYFLAVFMLSCLFGLLAAAGALLFGKKLQDVPGALFENVLYHLAVSQILCENLRVQTMVWGFVKVEQLFCALVCLGLLLRACCAYPRRLPTLRAADGPTSALILRDGQLRSYVSGSSASFPRRFWPIPVLLLCAGVLIAMIFALDGKIPMNTALCYPIILAVLAAMSGLEIYATRRRLG